MSGGDASPSGADAPIPEPVSLNANHDKEQGTSQKRKSLSESLSPEEQSNSKRVKLDGHDSGRHSPQESRRDRDIYRNGKDSGRDTRDGHSRNHDGSPPQSRNEPRRESFTSTADRQTKVSTEEKKRGQRLFGGLLSTLSQTTSNSQQKRRVEIERRQQEKAHQQKREDDKRRAEKLSKLNTIRKVEQVKFDEQAMRTRHSNMRAMAHSLQTRSEPKLFYRPWEPTAAQEDKIQDQIRDTEADIADEVQRFKRRKEARLKDLGVDLPSSPSDMVGDPIEDRSNDTQAGTTDDRPVAQPPKIGHEKDHDEDVMVEAEEDTKPAPVDEVMMTKGSQGF